MVLPVVYNERSIAYRERSAGMYGTSAYIMAQGFVELPYLTVQAWLYTIIVYFIIHFEFDAAKFFW